MRRREFIALAGASVAWPFAAMTQEAARTYRLGDLHLSPRNGPHNAALLDAVKADGFIAGQNLIVDDPGFGLRISALDDHASEIVKAHVDLILSAGEPRNARPKPFRSLLSRTIW